MYGPISAMQLCRNIPLNSCNYSKCVFSHRLLKGRIISCVYSGYQLCAPCHTETTNPLHCLPSVWAAVSSFKHVTTLGCINLPIKQPCSWPVIPYVHVFIRPTVHTHTHTHTTHKVRNRFIYCRLLDIKNRIPILKMSPLYSDKHTNVTYQNAREMDAVEWPHSSVDMAITYSWMSNNLWTKPTYSSTHFAIVLCVRSKMQTCWCNVYILGWQISKHMGVNSQ